jgi:hypothetical protein
MATKAFTPDLVLEELNFSPTFGTLGFKDIPRVPKSQILRFRFRLRSRKS